MRESPAELNEWFANAWQAASKFAGVQLGTCEKLAKAQSDLLSLWAECSARQLEVFNGRRDPVECVAIESALAAEYTTKLFDHVTRIFAIANEANGALMGCLGQRIPGAESAAEKPYITEKAA